VTDGTGPTFALVGQSGQILLKCVMIYEQAVPLNCALHLIFCLAQRGTGYPTRGLPDQSLSSRRLRSQR
jgi:hypothetical protein